jgi:hypothetical protein
MMSSTADTYSIDCWLISDACQATDTVNRPSEIWSGCHYMLLRIVDEVGSIEFASVG